MLLPALEIHVVWHPCDAGAEAIARALADHLAKPPGMKRGTTSCKLIAERVKKVIDAAPQRLDDPAGPMA